MPVSNALQRTLTVIAACILGAAGARAQDIELLDTVFPHAGPNPSSKPSGFYDVGGKVFAITGTGIYRCDPTGKLDGQLTPLVPTEVVATSNELVFTARGISTPIRSSAKPSGCLPRAPVRSARWAIRSSSPQSTSRARNSGSTIPSMARAN